jgi:amino acid adenylation domain-containing protein
VPTDDFLDELVGATRDTTARLGIPGLVRDRALSTPDQTACSDEERSLTYAELDHLSDRMAERITDVNNGVRGAVAIRLARSVDLVVGLLGILKAGCWYLPVGLTEPASRVVRMAALANPLAVVGAAGNGLDGLPALDVPTVSEPGSSPVALPEVDEDDPVYVLFTSGSTGEPKGVQVGSGALVNRLLWMQQRYGLRAGDRVLQKTPYTFDVSGWEFFWPLLAGACCVLAPPGAERDFGLLAETIRRRRITVCHFVPSVLDEFLRQSAPGETLRHVFCSGEALPAGLARRFLDACPAELHNLYGPTEAAIDVTQWTVPRALGPDDRVLIGAPVDNTVLRVAREDGTPVPAGDAGELWIAGKQLALGYVSRPDLTARAFPVVDGTRYYRTGDLVRLVGDQLEYLGRIDEQVKVRGVRVEPGEVEHVLGQHPAVRQAAVVPVGTDPTGGVELVAAFTRRTEPPPWTELRAFAADRLPPAYVPVGFREVDALPLNGTGKLDRARLREELTEWWLSSARAAAADTDDISRLWWQVVPRPATDSADQGFQDLGGHSLLAARLIGRLREELGVHLPITSLLRDNASLTEVRQILATADRETVAPSLHRHSGRSPFSPGQRWLWLASQMWPESGAHNVIVALHLHGPVQVDVLQAALADVIRRHDILRARVVMSDGEPELHYADTADPQWTLSSGADESAFIRRIAAQPIPMSDAPMLRGGLLVQDDGACLVLSFHHLVADQRSADIVLADLAAAYRGGSTKEAPSFAAYAESETRQVNGPRWAAALAYWRRTLADAPATTELPFSTPPSSRPTFAGRRHRRHLGHAVVRFCHANAVTPGAMVLTCLSAVVAKWTGQDTVVLGVPASRRRGGAEDDVVGFLVDTLAIRVDVDGEPTFDTLLRRVWERYTEVLEHHTPSFAAVVAELGLETRPTRNPLFQIWVNDLSHAAPPPDFAGIPASAVDLPDPPALFDLNLYLSRDADGYRVDLVRAVDRVAAEVADHVLDQVVALLDRVVEGLSPSWADLLPTHEVPRQAPYQAKPIAILDAIGRQAPEATAITVDGRTRTYREVTAVTAGIADQLGRHGVTTGSVVLVQARRTPHLIPALLGVWAAGGVAALVDHSPRSHTDVDIRALLKPAVTLEVTADGVRVADGLDQPRVIPHASHILFTSGSGGTPAPVAVPKAALPTFLGWYTDAFGFTGADRTGLLAGLGHDPVLRDICAPLVMGGSVAVPPEDVFDSPAALFRFVVEAELTVLHATPALLELLIAGARTRIKSLRLVVSGGAPLSAGLVRRLRQITDAQVVNAYGTTETPQIVCCHVVDDDSDLVPIGRGCAGHEVVVHTKNGRAAVGERGEIVVRGQHLAAGYLDGRNPERFAADPEGRVFRTGDMGRLDPWGRVHVDGRTDRQVLVNGHRIALEDIEHAALQHGTVVRARADHRRSGLGDVLDLRVVTDHPLDMAELRRHLRTLLPAHAVPARLTRVSTLDTDGNHKVGGPQRGYRTEWVDRLDALIRHELGLPIEPEQNLFDAGLNSVTLVRLHARWREDIGHDVAITALFANPTLGALDRALEGQHTDATTTRRADVSRIRAAGAIRSQIRRRIYQDSGGPQ